MSESAEDRTRKQMMARPELVEHMAFNTWCHETFRPGDIDAKAAWDTLPSEERGRWIHRVWEKRNEWSTLSDEEKAQRNEESFRRTLAINEAAIGDGDAS